MAIRILPDTLVNQIAAGEVIERPASVVKELVENAIDAGASSIEITLVDGGKSLIAVADNGKGMAREDLELAVERHATSKLPDDDLFHIGYLGFRGEALPSIASVARLSVTSRSRQAENGWRMEVNGGVKQSPVPAASAAGTRVEVRDLFYAAPARLKFLKTAAGEVTQCVDIVNRIALANPQISFYLIDEQKKKISLNACQGELFDARLKRLSDVMGREFGENSLLINAERDHLRISGYVSLPTYNKANSLSQYLFVNNRPVRDKLLLGAVKGAYQGVLEIGRYPLCALFFDVDPDYVDVNVHPTKAEVRFLTVLRFAACWSAQSATLLRPAAGRRQHRPTWRVFAGQPGKCVFDGAAADERRQRGSGLFKRLSSTGAFGLSPDASAAAVPPAHGGAAGTGKKVFRPCGRRRQQPLCGC